MSSRRRSTLRATRGLTGAPTMVAKKSKTVLIIAVAMIIVVVLTTVALLVYFLWWRRRGTSGGTSGGTTGSTKCASDGDCSGGKVCKTSTGVCVFCLEDGDCSGNTPVCQTSTNTCIGGCVSDANCDVPTPVCDVGVKTCVGCLVDGDCSGLTPLCDVPNTTCVECLVDGDCVSPSICESGVCCNTDLPLTFSILSSTHQFNSDETIWSISATFSQPAAGLTASLLIYDSNGDYLDRTTGFTPNNGVTAVSSNTLENGSIIFEGVTYTALLEISGMCGVNPYTVVTVTPVPFIIENFCTPLSFYSMSLDSNTRILTIETPASPPEVAVGIAVKLGISQSENDYQYIFRDDYPSHIYLSFVHTVTIPAGPVINPGDTFNVWVFSDNYSGAGCFGTPILLSDVAT